VPPDFEEFVVTRGRALIRFAYLLVDDAHLAEDLVQEALVRVHRRWLHIEHSSNPEPYVRTTIVRLALNWRRRRSSGEVALPHLPDRPDPKQPDNEVVERDAIWPMLSALPVMQRAVLVLRYYEDLADADIAAILGCSPATVRVHAFKALNRLRSGLADGLMDVRRSNG
jgi:RNA polymerase sigma-70 factor (sigma-E family)